MPSWIRAPVLHDPDPVGDADGLGEVVGDEDDGLAQGALQTEELVLHLAPDQRVEGGERLVEEPDVGLDRQRAGDADALLLPARELAREVALAALQPDQPDHLAGARLAPAALEPLHLERERHIVQHGPVRQQPEMLEHHAHLVAAQLDQAGLVDGKQVACPSKSTSPAVGSISRDRQRIRVDLPEPDRPMTTRISPAATSEADIAHGGDIAFCPAGLERGRAAMAGEKARRIGAVEFPEPAAGDLGRSVHGASPAA